MLAIRVRKDHLAIGLKLFSAVLLVVVASVSLRDAHISAQDFPAVIGRIEGDDLEVATTTPSGVERNAAPTVVASGSDVTLRSGHALLMLNTGGEISVCGPAHFKLIQSSGSVTLALDYGRVHPSLESSDAFTIYTPTIVATPIAIAGGTRDTTLGLDQSGEMCVLTGRGALRVEPQFAEQSVIVPQGGSVTLSGGQVSSLRADASACSCDYPRARLDAPTSAAPFAASASHIAPPVDIGALASPVAPPRRKTDNIPPPSASGKEPVYTVLMPALSFSANSPEPPPEPAPETIMLVREVRLRPLYEFRGRVNPPPEQSAPTQPQSASPASASPSQQAPAPKPGFFDRMRNFFRSLASSTETSPCAGVGCPS